MADDELDEKINWVSSFPFKTRIRNALLEKLDAIFLSWEKQEKYYKKISHKNVIVLRKLIKRHPDFFRVVQSILFRNITDNEIKTDNIPAIISIISKLYHILLIHKDDEFMYIDSPIEICSQIIKFIVYVAIQENIVDTDTDTDKMLLFSYFDRIVDSCVKLLDTPKPYCDHCDNETPSVVAIKTSGSCWRCCWCFRVPL